MLFKKKSINYYLFIIATTALLYLWQLHQYPMINPDGILYLESAAAYVKKGGEAVLAFDAHWRFYPICIAYVHLITGMSIPVAERWLDGLFIILAACSFLYLTQCFSQHKAAYFWGTTVWLTWHAYVKWWPEVVRDHGFVAILSLSIVCYYRFLITQRFFWGLAWSLSIFLAVAFRGEAVLYLIFVPFSVFLLKNHTFSQRCYFWLKLSFLPIIFIIMLGLFFSQHPSALHSLRFFQLWQQSLHFYSMMANRFMWALNLMHAQIFYRENDFVVYGLVASYLVVFIGYIIAQVSLAALPPLFFARRVWHRLNPRMLSPCFIVYFSVAMMTPLLFFVSHAFLNGRYLLPLGLLSLLFVASILPYIIHSLPGKKKIYFILLVGLLLLTNAMANVFRFGHQANENYKIGQWLKKHYPGQTVFTNVREIFFYTHGALGSPDIVFQISGSAVGAAWLGQHDAWCHYDLLVMSAPTDKTKELRQVFVQFQQKKALGPIIENFSRASHHENILIAPVNAAGCKKLVASQASLT